MRNQPGSIARVRQIAACMCLALGVSCSPSPSHSSDHAAAPLSPTQVPEAPVQQPARVFRLLIDDSQTGEPYQTARLALVESLKNWGYAAGKNLEVTSISIENDLAGGESLLREQLEKDYDVIVTNGTVMTLAAKNVALGKSEQNFVFACVTDPVGLGVIEDFSSPPKYNFTGVSYPVPVRSRFKFIRELMPQAKKIGLIYAAMPQSLSYRRWIEELFASDPELSDVSVFFREVPLVTGAAGSQEMAELARDFVKELDPLVDVFVSPNDQMGIQEYFARIVSANATKPLVGLGRNDVMLGWGATMVIYPSHISMGKQAARMVKELFEGIPIAQILPEWPKECGFAFDLGKAAQFGIQVPVEYIELAGDDIVP